MRRTQKMVDEIEKAMGEDIDTLDWMTPKTKQQAVIKLHGVTNKIGYPDKWRDYERQDRARRCLRQRHARRPVRGAAPARQDRQARG